MACVYYDYLERDGSINTLYPREDFAHADSTDSNAPLTTEATESALAAWIVTRKLNKLSGAVLLRSKINQRNGRYSIDKIKVA